MEDLDAGGTKFRSNLHAVRAECHLRLGQVREGLEVVTTALREIQESEGRTFVAEINRLKGELLARHGARSREDAEPAFREAIRIAQHQQTKSWELRATTSLARLLRDTNRHDEARATSPRSTTGSLKASTPPI